MILLIIISKTQPKTPTNSNVSQYNEITKPDVQKENETGIKIQENNVYEFGTTMKIDLANVDHITQSMGDNSNYSLVIYEKNNGEREHHGTKLFSNKISVMGYDPSNLESVRKYCSNAYIDLDWQEYKDYYIGQGTVYSEIINELDYVLYLVCKKNEVGVNYVINIPYATDYNISKALYNAVIDGIKTVVKDYKEISYDSLIECMNTEFKEKEYRKE